MALPAEQQLALLRAVFAYLPDGVAFIDADYVIRAANEAFARQMRRPLDRILDRPADEVIPGWAAQVAGIYREVRESRKPFHAEAYPFEFADQPERGVTYWDTCVSPVYRADGSFLGYLLLHREVTERVRIEQALRAERDRAQKYLDVVGVMVVVINANGKVSLINRAGCEFLGYREEEIVGRDWFDAFIPSRLRQQVRSVFEKLVAGEVEPVERHVNPVLTRSGEERVIAWQNTVLRDEAGRVTATLSSGEDITDRLRAESAREQFVQLAAHELRTPLTTLKGLVQVLLKRGPHDEEERRLFQVVNAQANRMAHLIQTLVDASRIQGGELVLHRSRVDLCRLTRDVVEAMQAEASPRHQLSVTCEGSTTVEADPERVREVLVDLVDNAVKYSPRGGPIEVTVRSGRGEVIACVRDYGIGIPKERRAELFEAFYQVAPMVSPTRGMGLGLFISREVIRRHGGRIWFESEEGQGSTFCFSLPRT